MRLQRPIQGMVGEGGLDDDAARLIGASCPSRHLHQLRIQFFGGAKIAAIQRAVGIEHAHQRKIGEIVPFSQHLRANQNVHLVRVYLRAHGLPGAFVARAVPVDTQDARVGKAFLQYFFDALRAAAHRMEIGIAAIGATLRHPDLITAMMAAQTLVF